MIPCMEDAVKNMEIAEMMVTGLSGCRTWIGGREGFSRRPPGNNSSVGTTGFRIKPVGQDQD